MKRLTLALVASLTLCAQNPYGRVGGRVLDTSGAAVPQASIRLTNLDTGVATSTTSNPEGNYELPNLLPGRYKLEAELSGFKRYERGPFEVRVGDVLSIDPVLEPGVVTESVRVTAEAPLLEAATSKVGLVVDNRRIQELPLPGGNPMYLVLLSPGVITTNAATHGWLPLAVDSLSAIASGGSHTFMSEFTLDGIPNMSRGGQMSFSPPPEAVQEFKVETASFDASVGHFTGANVNMVLKSGTNQLHGVLHFGHLSRPLMTRPFFTNRSIYDLSTGPVTQEKINRFFPPARTNRYRANASGPVYWPKLYDGRNRTFWMYSYDKVDRILPQQSYLTVPTAAQRSGDFSDLLALGSQYQIFDPSTARATPDGRIQRDPLPGNRIPANRLDPVGRRIVEYFGLPNVTGTADGRNNFSDGMPRNIQFHSHTLRVDQALGQAHRLYGSYSRSYLLEEYARSFFPNNLSRGGMFNRFHRGFTLSDVVTLRPNLVLDLRYGITRFIYRQRPHSLGFDLGSLGFPSALVNQLDRALTAFPETIIDGYTSLGARTGVLWATNFHTLASTATYLRGNHSLRFGGEYRVLQDNNYDWGNVAPALEFGTAWTRGPFNTSPAAPIGQGLATMLLGIPTGGSISRNASFAEQSEYLAVFLQDDVRLTSKLTLNLGLRYELELPTTERFDRTNRGFDFATPNPIQQAARANYARNPIPEIPVEAFVTRGGLLFANTSGVPRALFDADKNNFSPRVGLAWRFLPAMVMRAGYGVFFESIGADRSNVVQQGFSQATLLRPSLDNGLTFRATLANPFPDGLLEPPGASLGLRTFLGRAASYVTPDYKAGYFQRWTFNLQREFPHRVVMELGYMGSRSTGRGVARQLNPVPRRYLSASPLRDQATIDFLSRLFPNPFYGLPEFADSNLTAATVSRAQLLRPFPHFIGISTTLSEGFSWYHSLQVRAEKRFSHGYTVQVSYTWSKLMDAMTRLNETDPMLHHVISAQDRPHQIVGSFIYELPFGKGQRWLAGAPMWQQHIVGGWQVQGVYHGTSGPPIGFGNIIFIGHLHDIVLPRSQRKVERWFNTAAGFDTNPRTQLDWNIRTFPLRLTGLRADGTNNWNLSVLKNFSLREGLTLQLRAEAQDALNHAMFAAPNTVPTSTLFGQVTATQFSEQRRIYVIGRLLW